MNFLAALLGKNDFQKIFSSPQLIQLYDHAEVSVMYTHTYACKTDERKVKFQRLGDQTFLEKREEKRRREKAAVVDIKRC